MIVVRQKNTKSYFHMIANGSILFGPLKIENKKVCSPKEMFKPKNKIRIKIPNTSQFNAFQFNDLEDVNEFLSLIKEENPDLDLEMVEIEE